MKKAPVAKGAPKTPAKKAKSTAPNPGFKGGANETRVEKQWASEKKGGKK